ncbi:MAG: endonuclease/exonuclease/phosphatase family protein [Pseudomonadota bacterium]
MQYEPDIAFLTETSLTKHDDNSVFLCRKDYEVFRRDRIMTDDNCSGHVGGGVAVLCKRAFHPCVLGQVDDVEGLWIELTKPKKILVGCFYRPHVSLVDQMHRMIDSFKHKLSNYEEVVICGDFNLPGIDWSDLTASTSLDQNIFLSEFLVNGLKQHILFPTFPRSGNTLDLVFSSTSSLTENPRPHDDVTVSDHTPVFFYISLPDNMSDSVRNESVLDFKNMDRGLTRFFRRTRRAAVAVLAKDTPPGSRCSPPSPEGEG